MYLAIRDFEFIYIKRVNRSDRVSQWDFVVVFMQNDADSKIFESLALAV